MTDQIIKLPDLAPMHQAVGKGISMFASIEFAVGMVFASMLTPAPRGHSVAVINAARSFEAKLKMIDALAVVVLSEVDLARWRNLSGKIARRKTMRDRLAHWTVSAYPGATTAEDIKNMRPALVPPFWSKQHQQVMWSKSGPIKPIFLPQLEEFTSKAGELINELLEFSTELQEMHARDTCATSE